VNTAPRALPVRPLFAAAGLIAAAALIWYVGPVLTFGQLEPLASDWSRWIAIAISAAIAVAYAVSRAQHSAYRNRRLMDGLVTPAPGARDVAVIGKRFEEAIALLKNSRLGGKHALFAALAGRPFVYELPWYIIIGAPGAGKTTALVNSGLEFPLAAKLGNKVLRGIGGTRNCDWWFAADAVLVDTAGRFTTQDSDREADRAAWMSFLDLLARNRPRRPINGVLLTISVSDLLNASPEERLVHARRLRERVDELHARLDIEFPIYVLITKADLLAGFMEFFADFDKDERAQVWGVTFPLNPTGTVDDPLTRLGAELAALEKRLDECLIDRLQSERDRDRRAAIYAFPQQWRVLRETLLGFLQSTFAELRGQRKALVRGVYFTSATQEGTPMDRALGGLARALGLSTRIVPAARPSGKTFFVTRLLREVVFAEAGLAGTNVNWERRRAWLEWGAIGLTVAAVAIALALAGRAYVGNQRYVAAVSQGLQGLHSNLAIAKNSARTDLVALVPTLDSVQKLAHPADVGAGDGPLAMGLDQSAKLVAAAQESYLRVLRDAFLPRIAARLEERLRAGEKDHVELIYEALKSYLMLFGGRNFDAAALRAYLGADWDVTLPHTVSAAERAALRKHLDQLLAGGEVGAPSQADRGLIDKARSIVAGVPLSQRVYNRLKQLGASTPAFNAEAAAGPGAKKVFVRTSGRPLSDGVPGLYSRAVFQQSYRERSQEVLRQFAAEQNWVLDAASARADATGENARLHDEIEQLYLADYGRLWEEFLRDIRVVPSTGLAQGADVAQMLARPDSPLVALLTAVVREVTIGLPRQPTTSGATRAAASIDERFDPLRRFVAGQPSLAETLNLLGKLSAHLAAVDDAVKRKTAAPISDVTRELAQAAPRTPEPVRGMLHQLAAMHGGQLFTALREQIGRQLADEVSVACKGTAEGRYPLVLTSDVVMSREEFVRVFSAGGLIDRFFQRNLAPFADTSTRTWAFRRADGRPEPAASLQQFQRAQSIRDAFFRDGGRTLGVRLEFRLLEMDPGVSQFSLDVDGQLMRFRRDTKSALSVQWPGPGGAQRVVINMATGAGGAGSEYTFDGPWALFQMFNRVRVTPGPSPDRVQVVFDVEGRKARFEIKSAAPLNPIRLPELEQFQCPDRL